MLARIIIWDTSGEYRSIHDIREIPFRTPKGEVSRYFGKAMSSAEQDCREYLT